MNLSGAPSPTAFSLKDAVTMLAAVVGMLLGLYNFWDGRKEKRAAARKAAELEANPVILTLMLEYAPIGEPRTCRGIAVQRVETVLVLRAVNMRESPISIMRPYVVVSENERVIKFDSPLTFPFLLAVGGTMELRMDSRELLGKHGLEELSSTAMYPVCELAQGGHVTGEEQEFEHLP